MTSMIEAGVLDVAYEEHGGIDGVPVMLMHGFPYDIHAYDDVASILADAGCRVIVPYLRGYGPTRFLSPDTLRSGEQAVLGQDLKELMDALDIDRAIVAGYDWGGRAACIVAALWPERALGLVTGGGYNIQHIPTSLVPADPINEMRLWYQFYFHNERGRAGLAANRHPLCKLLWQTWSPKWRFDDATYEKSAGSFQNPDFVDVVIQSYRHRYAFVEGDQSVLHIEQQLEKRPQITVPTICLDGEDNGVMPVGGAAADAKHFGSAFDYRTLPGIGHNIPQESPQAFAQAVLDLRE